MTMTPLSTSTIKAPWHAQLHISSYKLLERKYTYEM